MPDDAPFRMSKHARRRLEQRGVTTEQLRRALLHPDRVESDPEDDELRHAIKRFHVSGDSTVLRVVYNHTESPWVVVTAFFDRKAKRKP